MKIIRLLFLIGFSLLSQLAFSQYYYTTGSGDTPEGLNQDPTLQNPQVNVGGWIAVLGPSETTPRWSAIQTIPFSFDFNGSPVTDFKVSSTGVLTFSTNAVTVPGSTPLALPDATIPDHSICLWGLEANGVNDHVSTKTFGPIGSQQHWIHFSSCSNGNINFSYWSIVLEEGTNNIYMVDQYDWGAGGAMSVGIQIDNATAYSDPDSPEVMVIAFGPDIGTINDFYYKFIQGVYSQNDVKLASIDLSPYVAPGFVDVKGTIENTGFDPITTLSVTWDDGIATYTDNITGLNILANQTYDFTSSSSLYTVAGNSYTLDVNVTVLGDGNPANNDMSASTASLTSLPLKYIVGEEKTGTWCGWCPKGAVGLANMESVSNFIGIAVHNDDPMTIPAYDGSIGTYIPGGYPTGGVDRFEVGDASTTGFLEMYNKRSLAIAPCDVKNIDAVYNSLTNVITVSADSEWFGTISGDYRFSCIIVEDDIMGFGSDWMHVNYYSGGGSGTMAFPAGINNEFDFSTGTDPVDHALFGGYDHVARSLSNNDILGDVGSLPIGSVPMGVHSYSFAPVSANLVNDVNKCHAIVMVINAKSGEILNAYKSGITGGTVAVKELENSLELKLYPNPATAQVNVTMNLQAASDAMITVVDALGNIVISSGRTSFKEGVNVLAINTSVLSCGLYFINLVVDNQIVTKKLYVVD